MMIQSAMRCVAAVSTAVILLGTPVALAGTKDLPIDTIRIVSPYAPGGTSDIGIRHIAKRASEISGINVIIESKPGGAGAVAASSVKSSRPDGSVLMLIDAGTFAWAVTVNPQLTYHPLKDFEPITELWAVPSMLAVPASSPANSIKELLAYGRRKKGGLSFASQSVGSVGHLLGSILSEVSGQKMVHVPYRGSLPAATDLAAGRVDFLFSSYPTFRGLIDSGKLKLIATTSKARDPNYPKVSTVAEQGYPELEAEVWFGLAAPANTPPTVVHALNALFVKAAQTPTLIKKLTGQGIFIKTDTPEEFKKMIGNDIAKYRPIILKAGAVLK